jgi:hypothetical protein
MVLPAKLSGTLNEAEQPEQVSAIDMGSSAGRITHDDSQGRGEKEVYLLGTKQPHPEIVRFPHK